MNLKENSNVVSVWTLTNMDASEWITTDTQAFVVASGAFY